MEDRTIPAISRVALLSALVVLGLAGAVNQANAQQYWDTNGSGPGAGGPAPNGNWSDANWGSVNGDTATATYTASGNVVFSAGTDATGSYFVTNNNGGVSRAIGSITVEDGYVTILGDDFGTAGKAIVVKTGKTLELNSAIGGAGLTFTPAAGNNGRTILNASNYLSGTVTWGNNGSSATAGATVRAHNSLAFGTATLTLDTGGNSSASAIEFEGNIGITNNLNNITTRNSLAPDFINVGGTNVYAGAFALSSGGSRFTIRSDAGKLILANTSPGYGATSGGRVISFDGVAEIEVPGLIANRSGTINVERRGTGKTTLDNTMTYSGVTTIQGGTLALGPSGVLANSSLVEVWTGAAFDASAPATSTFGSAVAQTLTGTNGIAKGNFVFATFGTLRGILSVQGSVEMQSGSTNLPGNDLVAGTTTVATNFTLDGGSVMRFDLGNVTTPGGTNNDLIAVGGQLAINGSTSLELRFLKGALTAGAYTLFTYSTFSGDAANIQTPVSARYTYTITNDTAAKAIKLLVSGISANLVWKGDGFGNYWDEGGSQNWLKDGVTPDYFYDGDNLTFNDVGSNNPPVYLTATAVPGSLLVNSTNDYTFGGYGTIAGTVGLIKSNTGVLTLETMNTYSGGTLLAGGKLIVGTSAANGDVGPGSLSNLTELVVGGVSTVNLSASISGTGSLVKSNSNRINLTGVNTYSGNTTVAEGTLSILANSVPSWNGGNLDIKAGAVFDINNAAISIKSLTGDGDLANTGPNERFISVGAGDAAGEFYGRVLGRSPVQLFLYITKQGTNTLLLGGEGDNFNVGLTVNAGTVILAKTNPLARAVGSTFVSANPLQVNGGSLVLSTNSAGDQILDGASVNVNSNGRFVLNGQSETLTAINVNNGGTLEGPGAINAFVNVAAGAKLELGPALSVMAISNRLTLAGTTAVKVSKTAGTNDVFVGMTDTLYGGALVVSNLAGTIVMGDSFQVFQPDVPGTGAFTSITPPPGAGLAWSFDAGTGFLTAVQGPSTTPTNITFSLTAGNLTLTWPVSHLGWIAQSNSVDLAYPASWHDIPGSGFVTNLVIPVEVSLPKVFYRLRLP